MAELGGEMIVRVELYCKRLDRHWHWHGRYPGIHGDVFEGYKLGLNA